MFVREGKNPGGADDSDTAPLIHQRLLVTVRSLCLSLSFSHVLIGAGLIALLNGHLFIYLLLCDWSQVRSCGCLFGNVIGVGGIFTGQRSGLSNLPLPSTLDLPNAELSLLMA